MEIVILMKMKKDYQSKRILIFQNMQIKLGFQIKNKKKLM